MIKKTTEMLCCTSVLVVLSARAGLVTEIAPASEQIRAASGPFETVFAMDQKNDHLGGGVGMSPDGRLLAYVGEDDGLYLRSVEGGRQRLLLSEAGPGLDVFSNPVFSASGKEILFVASGGTRHYPSNIYSVQINGSALRRVTRGREFPLKEAEEAGGSTYEQYFYSPQPSPSGTKILLRVYESVTAVDNVALMEPDGSHLEIVTRGTPRFWSSDSRALFFESQEGKLKRFDLMTRQSRTIRDLKGRVLGKLPDGDTFGVDGAEGISLESVQDESARFLTRWNVPMARVADGEQLTLTSFQWSRSGRILFVYEGDQTERFEVVQPSRR